MSWKANVLHRCISTDILPATCRCAGPGCPLACTTDCRSASHGVNVNIRTYAVLVHKAPYRNLKHWLAQKAQQFIKHCLPACHNELCQYNDVVKPEYLYTSVRKTITIRSSSKQNTSGVLGIKGMTNYRNGGRLY